MENISLEVPFPKSVLNLTLTPSQGKYTFDPVGKVLTWDVGRMDPTKLPSIKGNVSQLYLLQGINGCCKCMYIYYVVQKIQWSFSLSLFCLWLLQISLQSGHPIPESNPTINVSLISNWKTSPETTWFAEVVLPPPTPLSKIKKLCMVLQRIIFVQSKVSKLFWDYIYCISL